MFVFLEIKESTSFFFILLSIILFFFCLYLYFNDKKLKQRILDLEQETKEILERKILKNISDGIEDDLVSIQNISVELNEQQISENTPSKKNKKGEIKKEMYPKQETTTFRKETTGLQVDKGNGDNTNFSKIESLSTNQRNNSYQTPKYIATPNNQKLPPKIYQPTANNTSKVEQEKYSEKFIKNTDITMKYNYQQSKSSMVVLPTNNQQQDDNQKNYPNNEKKINNTIPLIRLDDDKDDKKYNNTISLIRLDDDDEINVNNLSFNVNEFVKKNEKIVPKIKENNNNNDYLKEISNQISNELKPQTIELTDYEKDQEEHAVISYKELLALKERIDVQDNETENINFIDDLKQFRSTLN